jgi:tetratricopeptide (TPR) repeat protein
LDGFLESRGSLSFQPRVEMGIAAGGRIKQQIFEDTYGADSWDESVARDVVIHIVNSKAYQRITGCPAPPSPITSEQYARCKIPWYSAYDEKDLSVKPVGVFKRIFSIGKIDKGRGIAEEALPKHAVSPEQIVRIRTQTLEERWKALVERAKQSLANGNHHIARREASLALDLFDKDPLPFFIRAISNHRLGHYSDSEADASACLTLQPNHMGALSVRAYSSLALGETLLAKNDAEMILASQFDNHDALYVRAEANLRLAHYDDAIGDAERMLQSDPADPAALRIREQALTSLSQNPSR